MSLPCFALSSIIFPFVSRDGSRYIGVQMQRLGTVSSRGKERSKMPIFASLQKGLYNDAMLLENAEEPLICWPRYKNVWVMSS